MGFVTACFERKPIAQMVPEGEGVLRRALGAGDLIMLSIGAVIGAGIFGSIGSAAAGEFDAAGHIDPDRRGPRDRVLIHPGGCSVARSPGCATRKSRR